MVLTFSKLLEVRLQVLVERIAHAPLHWMGRSVLCSGPDCPACEFRSPRLVYYCGCVWAKQRRVVEVPSSFASVIDDGCRMCGVQNPVGLVLHLKRHSTRDAWKVWEAERQALSCDPISEREMAREVAHCLRLATPIAVETWSEWIARVRISQALILRNCVSHG